MFVQNQGTMNQGPHAHRLLLLVGLVFLSGTLALKAASADARPVVFVPQWEPQAQFAGYYVAVEKGFYARYGLKVTVLRGGPDQPIGRLLQEGQADFATTFLTSALEKRSLDGLALVNIAQMVQRSSLLLVAPQIVRHPLPRRFAGQNGQFLAGFRCSTQGPFP